MCLVVLSIDAMSILVASLSVVKVSFESSNVLEVPLTAAACELDGRSLFAPFLRAEKGWTSLVVDFEGSSVMYMIVSGVRNSGDVSQYVLSSEARKPTRFLWLYAHKLIVIGEVQRKLAFRPRTSVV